MKIGICSRALPLALIGCVEEPPPVATTTTVTREVTTTAPATGEVLVTQAPPPVRVETLTVAPGPNYIWTPGYWRWTGTTYVWMFDGWVCAAEGNGSMGQRPLGAPSRRLGLDRGPLAVIHRKIAA
jgi:hypothetical protein